MLGHRVKLAASVHSMIRHVEEGALKVPSVQLLQLCLTVQSPEYAEVNVTVECVAGSNEEAQQPAPGLSIFRA